MKYLVASDIHGSVYFAKKLEERILIEKPDKIILLGDLYYHGPRNNLTTEYNPMEVSKILNKYKDKIICTRGNCDAEVDEMICEFSMQEKLELEIKDKKFFFSHGHKYNIDNVPSFVDFVVYGHKHIHFIEKEYGVTFVNVGSVSIPREESTNSYVVIENNIIIKSIEGKELQKCNV